MAKKHSSGREQHQPPRTSAKPSPVCLSRAKSCQLGHGARAQKARGVGNRVYLQRTKHEVVLFPSPKDLFNRPRVRQRRAKRAQLTSPKIDLAAKYSPATVTHGCTPRELHKRERLTTTYEEPCTFEKFEHTVCLNRKGTVAWHGDQSLSMAAKFVTHGPTKPSSPMICATYSRERG